MITNQVHETRHQYCLILKFKLYTSTPPILDQTFFGHRVNVIDNCLELSREAGLMKCVNSLNTQLRFKFAFKDILDFTQIQLGTLKDE